MNLDRPNEASTLSLIRENRRLRELVVSLSATLLRSISREATESKRHGGSDVKAGLRKAKGRAEHRILNRDAERVPIES
jgi:hypothetical protein